MFRRRYEDETSNRSGDRRRVKPLAGGLSVLLLSVVLFGFFHGSHSKDGAVEKSDKHAFRIVTVAKGLNHPWGLAFLPNGDMLVTERSGQLRVIRQGKLDPKPVRGLPDNIAASGQGGLLDVALHPDFAKNRMIYLSYSGRGKGGAGTEVARGRLSGDRLENLEVIFRVSPKTGGTGHYGSRLVFATDGTLFITTGDRRKMKEAQNPGNHLGTVLRLRDDGSVPPDNPFIGRSDVRPEIFSYGHRNGQGMALRPGGSVIWMHEHGAQGGDEVNILRPGANYGWPAITYGVDYGGGKISDKTSAPGMEQPVVYWDPSIAPSGMAFYDGDRFPEWRGNLFVGALKLAHLRRLELKGDKVVAQEELLEDLDARIRDVRNGPDGYLYVLTDSSDGRLIRLEPEGP
jgi:aldose sugar dehydrogenase